MTRFWAPTALVLALAGCQLVLPLHHETDAGGGSDASGGGDGGQCSAANTMNQACNDCLDRYCCHETTVCELDGDCVMLGQCAGFCLGSSSCIANCKSQYPGGESDYDALIACTAMHCSSMCSN